MINLITDLISFTQPTNLDKESLSVIESIAKIKTKINECINSFNNLETKTTNDYINFTNDIKTYKEEIYKLYQESGEEIKKFKTEYKEYINALDSIGITLDYIKEQSEFVQNLAKYNQDKIDNGTVATKTDINTIDNKLNKTILNVSNVDIVNDENIVYNSESKTYSFTTDYFEKLKSVINEYDMIILPKINIYISDTIEITKPITIQGQSCNIYTNPVNGKNKPVFKITCDNVNIEGINFYSKNEYSPKVGTMKTTGKSSNIYAIQVNSSNVNIKNCNSYECFICCYVNGTSENIIHDIIIDNVNSYECCFGIHCYYVNNFYYNNSYTSVNTTGLNDYFHNIYIGSTCTNVFINEIQCEGGTNERYDIISLHDSITETLTINNIHFTNIYSKAKARSFITFGHCKNIFLNNCNHYDMDLNYQKGLINTQDYAVSISIKNCKFTLHNAYSIINCSDGGEKCTDLKISECEFTLRDTYLYVFRHMRSLRMSNCIFYLNTGGQSQVTFFRNDNTQIPTEKSIVMNNICIIPDNNTSLIKLLVNESNINDYITLENIRCINPSYVEYCNQINENTTHLRIFNCSMFNYRKFANENSNFSQFNNIVGID